jgi:hypothetical protein
LLSGEIPQWRGFSLTFTVPPEGCRAQQIRLDLDARSASEKLVTGSMWFDDLALTRGPTPEPRSGEWPPSPEL